MSRKIINTVKNCKTLSWKELKTYEFNNLKEDQNRDVSKLKNLIVSDYFCFPFFIWEGNNYCIDGAGRRKVLLELEEEGYIVDDLPIVEIQAEKK